MRVIALVSLALALAVSSMPLTTRADGGVSTTKEESTGTLGATGSGLGNAVNPPGSGTASAAGLENGSLGSSAASGSESGGGVYKSGSSTTSGLGSGSINPARRSTISGSSAPGDVNSGVSTLDGKAASAAGDTVSVSLSGTSYTAPVDASGAWSVVVGATDTLRLRAVTGSASGAGQAVGGLSEIAGAAAG